MGVHGSATGDAEYGSMLDVGVLLQSGVPSRKSVENIVWETIDHSTIAVEKIWNLIEKLEILVIDCVQISCVPSFYQ